MGSLANSKYGKSLNKRFVSLKIPIYKIQHPYLFSQPEGVHCTQDQTWTTVNDKKISNIETDFLPKDTIKHHIALRVINKIISSAPFE